MLTRRQLYSSNLYQFQPNLKYLHGCQTPGISDLYHLHTSFSTTQCNTRCSVPQDFAVWLTDFSAVAFYSCACWNECQRATWYNRWRLKLLTGRKEGIDFKTSESIAHKRTCETWLWTDRLLLHLRCILSWNTCRRLRSGAAFVWLLPRVIPTWTEEKKTKSKTREISLKTL